MCSPGPGAPSEQQPHPLAPATENTDGSLPANQKKQGRHTVYHHLSQLHLIRSTVAERYYQQVEFVNQALAEASRKGSGNIFSVNKSLILLKQPQLQFISPLLFFVVPSLFFGGSTVGEVIVWSCHSRVFTRTYCW